jgi:hypothetical protein
MRIRILALGLVWVASLCGQRRFSWQGYCFDHPAAPFCSGREYAIKPRPKESVPSRDLIPYSPTAQNVIVVGGIDWRFADPAADAVAGFNFSGLSASPLARMAIAQLGARQGLGEADVQKIFDALSGVEHVALSVRDNRVVVMVTGRVTDPTLSVMEPGLKIVPVSGNAMLFGHAGAVDQAVQRIAAKGAPAEMTRLAAERQANSDFWAAGSAVLLGPEAASAGVKRFSLAVSMRNRITTDMAFEFDGAPNADALRIWGDATIEGSVVHVRTSMEADEAPKRFGEIASSLLGQRLAAVVKAARYLPGYGITVPKQAGVVIYGLDGGPKEVNQYPRR